MNKLSIFSGIGGDDLASDMAGIKTVCFVERDANCRKVLSAHWPGVPIIEDVKDVAAKILADSINRGCEDRRQESNVSFIHPSNEDLRPEAKEFRANRLGIDIVSGGFPCQPHSVAGKRKGITDERDLWPEVRRILSEIKPRWFVGENVPGLLSSNHGDFFGGILSDLAALGYSVGWCTYGAVDVGAWHRRDRIFIVAYSKMRDAGQSKLSNTRREREVSQENRVGFRTEPSRYCQDATDTTEQGLERAITEGSAQAGGLPAERGDVSDTDGIFGQSGRTLQRERELADKDQGTNASSRQSESRMGLLADGFPTWLAEPDGVPRVATGIKARVAKLKALGNAVVPAQIYLVYKAIMEIENTTGRH